MKKTGIYFVGYNLIELWNCGL